MEKFSNQDISEMVIECKAYPEKFFTLVGWYRKALIKPAFGNAKQLGEIIDKVLENASKTNPPKEVVYIPVAKAQIKNQRWR